MATVSVDFFAGVMKFISESHGKFFMQIQGRFYVEHPFVFGKSLIYHRGILVGEKRLVIACRQIEKSVAKRRFYKKCVDAVSLVRVGSPSGGDAVVENICAFGVLHFGSQRISVRAADFFAENPVEARGNRQAFFGFGYQVEAVSEECGQRMGIVFGCADIRLAVFHFKSHTADILVAKNNGVVFGISPKVIGECSCIVSEVSKDDSGERSQLPSELNAVKIECCPAILIVAHCRCPIFMPHHRRFRFSVCTDIITVRSAKNADGNIFIQKDFAFQFNVLVGGVGRAEVLVKIRGEIGVDIAVNFYIDSEGGNCGGKNKKAKMLDHRFLCVKTHLGFKIEIYGKRVHFKNGLFCKLSRIMGLFQKFFSVLCVVLSVNAFAGPADSVMALSKKWFDSGKAWSLNFRARVDYAGSPESGFQSGDLLVTSGDMFRLRMAGMAIYSDGKNFWQWNKEQKQVLLKLLEDMESNVHPSELLFKYLQCKPLSMKQQEWNGQKTNVIVLDASQYDKEFQGMEVWLSAKDASPVRLVTEDRLGNVSTYEILNLNRQNKVNKDDFVLKPEKGIDVIDMR